jgi:hypothetical protein
MCISQFERKADKDQSLLESNHTPDPPTGAVSKAQKEEIVKHGPLNDVATSYYIKARSAEALGQTELTLSAYRKACRYTYARTWDTRGWFWSPSEESCDHH